MLSESIGESVGAKTQSISIYDWLQEVSRKQRDDIALVCMHQLSSSLSSITSSSSQTEISAYLRWSYGQLQRASHVFAASFCAAGIGPAMRILSFLGNGFEHHVALWAALELNCTFVPLNAKLGGNREGARHVIGMLEPSTMLKPHVPYKAWADHYYSLSSSHLATAVYLRTPKALFPIQRAKGWFKGSSQGWINPTASLSGGPRPSLDAHPIGIKGIKGSTQLPDIQALKIEHGIETSQVVKTALAIMTARHTGQTGALFGQSQAGRSWPFMPDWQVDRMPPAMDIDGPLLQRTLNRIPISSSSTVITLLESLQNEQLLNKHAYAPLNALFGALHKGIEGEGAFIGDAYQRQVFNWLPTQNGKLDDGRFGLGNLKIMQVESRTDCGLLWNCAMLDRETVQIHPTWDDAQLRQVEVKRMLDEILDIAEKLARKENWSKSLGEVVSDMRLGNGNS